MPAPGVAARTPLRQPRSREHDQTTRRVHVSGVSRRHCGRVRREDRLPVWTTRVESRQVRLAERTVGERDVPHEAIVGLSAAATGSRALEPQPTLTPLPLPDEQSTSGRWRGPQASTRPARGADRQPHGSRCVERHHASGPQRVHLLGRGCQAGDDPSTAHSPDPGGAGGGSAATMLLARVQAPRAHRQIAAVLLTGPRSLDPPPKAPVSIPDRPAWSEDDPRWLCADRRQTRGHSPTSRSRP